MRKLFLLTRLNLMHSLIERADMLLYTLSNCAFPLVILFVWLSFTPPGQSSVFSHDRLILYFLLVTIVKLVTSAWGGFFLSARIRRGAISPFLTQPTPYFYHYISNNIAEKVIKLFMLIPFLILLAYLLKLSLPTVNPLNLFVSLVSLSSATALFFTIDITIGLLSFWLDETSAISDAFGLFGSLLSGAFIPLAALPSSVHNLSLYLPFRYSLSLPVEIFMNQISGVEIVFGLLVQALWLITMIYLCRLLWHRGLRVYSASGA